MATIRKAAKPAVKGAPKASPVASVKKALAKNAPAKSARAADPSAGRIAGDATVATTPFATPDRTAGVWHEHAMDAREFSRKMTQGLMNQSRDSYDQIKKVSEEATASAQRSFDTADANLKAMRMRMIDFARQQTDAGFEIARSLATVPSPVEATQLWTNFLTRQPEAAAALQKDMVELLRKFAGDFALPMGGMINSDPFGFARRTV